MSDVPSPTLPAVESDRSRGLDRGRGVPGYFLGEAAEALLGRLHRYELGIFVAIAALGTVPWGMHFARRRRQRNKILEQRGSDASA